MPNAECSGEERESERAKKTDQFPIRMHLMLVFHFESEEIYSRQTNAFFFLRWFRVRFQWPGDVSEKFSVYKSVFDMCCSFVENFRRDGHLFLPDFNQQSSKCKFQNSQSVLVPRCARRVAATVLKCTRN